MTVPRCITSWNKPSIRPSDPTGQAALIYTSKNYQDDEKIHNRLEIRWNLRTLPEDGNMLPPWGHCVMKLSYYLYYKLLYTISSCKYRLCFQWLHSVTPNVDSSSPVRCVELVRSQNSPEPLILGIQQFVYLSFDQRVHLSITEEIKPWGTGGNALENAIVITPTGFHGYLGVVSLQNPDLLGGGDLGGIRVLTCVGGLLLCALSAGQWIPALIVRRPQKTRMRALTLSVSCSLRVEENMSMARRTAVDSTDSLPMKKKRRISPCWIIPEGYQKLCRAILSHSATGNLYITDHL